MLAALIPILAPILDRTLSALIPDPVERQRMVSDLYGQLAEADLSQLQVNRAEATHASLFVAGWRPAIGWICAAALAYQFVFMPIALWLTAWQGIDFATPPSLDSHIWELMFGMLGMGALRSLEKLKGIAGR